MHSCFLETDRLYLRQHEIADLDHYCAMEMDADVRKYAGGYPRKREDAETRFKRNLDIIKNGLGMWATTLKSNDDYIGGCGIYPHFDEHNQPINGEAAIGLYIAKSFWNIGYATEAGAALVAIGFQLLKLIRIVTLVETGNEAFEKVMAKLGFYIEKTEVGQWRTFHSFVLENYHV